MGSQFKGQMKSKCIYEIIQGKNRFLTEEKKYHINSLFFLKTYSKLDTILTGNNVYEIND